MKKTLFMALVFPMVILSSLVFAGSSDNNSVCPPPPNVITVVVNQPVDFKCADVCTFYVVAYLCNTSTPIGWALYTPGTSTYNITISPDAECVCVTLIDIPTCYCTNWIATVDCQHGGAPFPTFNIDFDPQ